MVWLQIVATGDLLSLGYLSHADLAAHAFLQELEHTAWPTTVMHPSYMHMDRHSMPTMLLCNTLAMLIPLPCTHAGAERAQWMRRIDALTSHSSIATALTPLQCHPSVHW